MVELYVKLVLSGKKTINDVPDSLRASVEAAVEDMQQQKGR